MDFCGQRVAFTQLPLSAQPLGVIALVLSLGECGDFLRLAEPPRHRHDEHTTAA